MAQVKWLVGLLGRSSQWKFESGEKGRASWDEKKCTGFDFDFQ
jgi:hypothetical protein